MNPLACHYIDSTICEMYRYCGDIKERKLSRFCGYEGYTQSEKNTHFKVKGRLYEELKLSADEVFLSTIVATDSINGTDSESIRYIYKV